MSPLLKIEDLHVHFDTEEGVVRAVEGVSFEISAGETLGIVGESGCGKSVTCHSALGLIPPNGRIVAGSVIYKGHDLLEQTAEQLDHIRGGEIAMIFQDPMSSLNPIHAIGTQIIESLVLHRGMSGSSARAETLRLLDIVGIPESSRRFKEYPHQLSGGMNQRAMIALALACRPHILIADEPSTALDVTIQAQILDLLRTLQREFKMAIILITHDLGVIAEMAEKVVVMYAGRIVEQAYVKALFHSPAHPYTNGLLDSLPRLDQSIEQLTPIEGSVPSVYETIPGCPFEPRCRFAKEPCRQTVPLLRSVQNEHFAACYYPRRRT
jgi:oligopeptide/dipeptide ABC transporter ATP-binding protein